MSYKISKCESHLEINELKEYYDAISPEEKNHLEFDFEKKVTNEVFYKVTQEGLIIGIGSIEVDRFSYDNFKKFIAKEYRGQGLGEALFDFVIDNAIADKKKRFNGTVREMNERTKLYFERKGFDIKQFGVIDGMNVSYISIILKEYEKKR